MDLTASIPRLSAYFAFGVQVDPGKAQSGAAPGRTGTQAGRVVDITAQATGANSQRNTPTQQAVPQRKSNIFLASPAASTYAPPSASGQAVRLLQSAQPLGQNLDAWA